MQHPAGTPAGRISGSLKLVVTSRTYKVLIPQVAEGKSIVEVLTKAGPSLMPGNCDNEGRRAVSIPNVIDITLHLLT